MPNRRGMRPAAALASIRYIGFLGALAALTLMAQRVGFADEAPPIVNEKFTNLAPAIKMLRAEVGFGPSTINTGPRCIRWVTAGCA
jgi:hypothetical protein